MRELLVVCMTGKKGKREVLRLLVPDFKDPGFYRQTVSYSAFFNRMAKRLHESKGKADLFMLRQEGDPWFEEDEALAKDPPINGIWEFYKAIGYDHKKKRFK